MPPAPANESMALMSPFFTPSAAAPLAQRDCNNNIACPALCKVPASCVLHQDASFLDADDACLALADKASFLIPEDSYLPGQENCAAPCAPASAGPVTLGSRPAPHPRSTAGGHTSASSVAPLSLQRQRMCTASTPYLLLDSPAFAALRADEDAPSFDDDGLFGPSTSGPGLGLDAASECFEKAVQALEMVQRGASSQQQQRPPLELKPQHLCVTTAHCRHHHHHRGHQSQPPLCCQQPFIVAAGATDIVAMSYMPYELQQQQMMPPPARRTSSLAGSPASSLPSAAAQWPSGEAIPEPPQQPASATATTVTTAMGPYAYACASPENDTAAESSATAVPPVSMGAATATPAAAGTFGGGVGGGIAAAGPWGPVGAVMDTQSYGGGVDVSGDAVQPQHQVFMALAVEEQDVASAAAPAPPPKTFHHKTGGPCDHCGATESPQWRRGPPTKPMLCNACGTRYRRTNQLNPASAYTPAGRAAAAAAAAAAAQQYMPAAAAGSNKRGTKRDSYGTQAKRGRGAASSAY